MRQTARIDFHLETGEKPFTIFLTRAGTPDDLRKAVLLAARGKRRQIVTDPEDFACNVIGYCWKLYDFCLTERIRPVLWHYSFQLARKIPGLNIKNVRMDLDEKWALFAWMGQERLSSYQRTLAGTAKYGKLVDADIEPKQRRRGRPSILQTNPEIREKMRGIPVPDYVDPELGPIYAGKPAGNWLKKK